MELIFTVTPCTETGGFVARWVDLVGGGISMQVVMLTDLQDTPTDAVRGYFDGKKMTDRLGFHFSQVRVLAVMQKFPAPKTECMLRRRCVGLVSR